VESVQRRGHAGPEIVAQVKAGQHDAVVLGARGLGRIGSMFGSVSRHVLHDAGVAVFIGHLPED
jgi:nucleotide-binding universal stress UspA family protein